VWHVYVKTVLYVEIQYHQLASLRSEEQSALNLVVFKLKKISIERE